MVWSRRHVVSFALLLLAVLACSGPASALAYTLQAGDIVYQKASDDSMHLARANGAEVGSLGVYGTTPRWSPDGRNVAFMESDPDWNEQLSVVQMASGDSYQISPGGGPDVWAHGVFTWDAAGINLIDMIDMAAEPTIPELCEKFGALPGGDRTVSTSVFGAHNEFIRHLAELSTGYYAVVERPYKLVEAKDGTYHRNYEPVRLELVDERGKVAKTAPIAPFGFYEVTDPCGSPDGSKVVFSASNSAARSDIIVWDTNANTVSALFTGIDDFNTFPRFTADGTSIVWGRKQINGEWGPDVWTMGANGSNPHLLISGATMADPRPAWGFKPKPFGWSIENGTDENRDDDWVVWNRVFPGDWMGYLFQDTWAWQDKGVFESGSCYGMAASADINYASNGDISGFSVGKQLPYYGLWSLVSKDTRLTGDTEYQIREYIEGFQLVQQRVPFHAGASATSAEIVNRLDTDKTPPILTIHANGEGHALVPYAYSHPAANKTDVMVYDCNWPGETGRTVHMDTSTGAWSYHLWDGEDWAGTGSTISWCDPADVSANSGGVKPQFASRQLTLTSGLLPMMVRTTGALPLLHDGTARRAGYASAGGALLTEIPGVQPLYKDASGPATQVTDFALPTTALADVTLLGVTTQTTGAHLEDADSAVSAEFTAVTGAADRVLVSGALDQVSVAPASGVRSVVLWAGNRASGGQTMFGVLEATTTAGDLTLSATDDLGRLHNSSASPKTVTLAVIGSGWVGRRTTQVTIPGLATIEFYASSPGAVTSSLVYVRPLGGSATAAGSSPFRSLSVKLMPLPSSSSYRQTLTASVAAAGDIDAAEIRLQTSTDNTHWSDAGSFASVDADNVATKPFSLAQNSHVRAVIPASSARIFSATASSLVQVRASLSLSAPASAKRKKSFTLSGTLRPRHAKGAKAVRVRMYFLSKGVWRAKGSVLLKVSNSGSASVFKTRLRLGTKGRWKLVASHSDRQHLATDSNTRYVTIKG